MQSILQIAGAAVLRRVASEVETGSFPSDVTLYEIGRALHTFCVKAPEPGDAIAHILHGLFDSYDPT
ncbi:MAG: hypothetical protein AAB469_00350 [Patescibacteria group bacterium]